MTAAGRLTLLVFVAGLLTLQVWPFSPLGSVIAQRVQIGAVWAGWSIVVWVSSYWAGQTLPRGICLVAGCYWHSFQLMSLSGAPLSRYLAMLGIYGVLQAVSFYLLEIPRWSPRSRADNPPVQIGHRQYGIADLLVLTTVSAITLAAIRHYEADAQPVFWWGLPVAILTLLCCNQLAYLAGLSLHPANRIVFLLITAAGCMTGSVWLALLEVVAWGQVVGGRPPQGFAPYAYLPLVATSAACLLVFSSLSRR